MCFHWEYLTRQQSAASREKWRLVTWRDFALSLKSKCISWLLSISQNKHHMSDANQCSHASTTVISFRTYTLETNEAISCTSTLIVLLTKSQSGKARFGQILHAGYLNPVSGRKTVCPSLVNIPKYQQGTDNAWMKVIWPLISNLLAHSQDQYPSL